MGSGKHTPRGGKKQKCSAKNAHGQPCKRDALAGEKFCYHHLPENREAIKAAAKKGGGCPRRPVLPEAQALDFEQQREVISGLIEGTINGTISDSISRACGYLLSIDNKIRELREIESRLAALENPQKRENDEKSN